MASRLPANDPSYSRLPQTSAGAGSQPSQPIAPGYGNFIVTGGIYNPARTSESRAMKTPLARPTEIPSEPPLPHPFRLHASSSQTPHEVEQTERMSRPSQTSAPYTSIGSRQDVSHPFAVPLARSIPAREERPRTQQLTAVAPSHPISQAETLNRPLPKVTSSQQAMHDARIKGGEPQESTTRERYTFMGQIKGHVASDKGDDVPPVRASFLQPGPVQQQVSVEYIQCIV